MSIDSFEWERSGELKAKLTLRWKSDSGWQKMGEVGGLDWNARLVYSEHGGNEPLTTVLVSVDVSDGNNWSYDDVNISASIVSKSSNHMNLTVLPNKNKNSYPREHCWIETCPFPGVKRKDCYDSKDDSMVLSVKIQVANSCGTNPRRVIDFGSEVDDVNDVQLIVEGKAIAVSMNYLAMYSPFFHSLFYRDFSEKGKEKIEMSGVKYEDVIQLLKIIYPSHCKVTASNVEGVAFLSDVWDISVVRRKCDKFLTKDVVKPDSNVVQKVSLAKKILYASRYALPRLQHALISAIDKKKMIEVMESIEYKEEYNDSDRVYLLKRFRNI